jgi:hypothetical protein
VVKLRSFLFVVSDEDERSLPRSVVDDDGIQECIPSCLQLEFKHSTAIGPELSKEIILHVVVYDL